MARVCYETAIHFNVATKENIIFFHEDDPLDIIKETGATIVKRNHADNFGGLGNAKIYFSELSLIMPFVNECEGVIFCDSDIVFTNDFTEIKDKLKITIHSGVFGDDKIGKNIPHISGQLNYICIDLIHKLISITNDQFDEYANILLHHKYSIADDTLLSVISYFMTGEKMNLKNSGTFEHIKLNEEDCFKIISDVKDSPFILSIQITR
jgi:hypothetical protein